MTSNIICTNNINKENSSFNSREGDFNSNHNNKNMNKKLLKKMRYKPRLAIDLENHEELLKYMHNSYDVYSAALDLVELACTHKLESFENVFNVITSCLREKTALDQPLDDVPLSIKLSALEKYIKNRWELFNFELFDSTFGISQIKDKKALGKFLISQIDSCNENLVEKIMNMFIKCNIDHEQLIIDALLLIFLKVYLICYYFEYY